MKLHQIVVAKEYQSLIDETKFKNIIQFRFEDEKIYLTLSCTYDRQKVCFKTFKDIKTGKCFARTTKSLKRKIGEMCGVNTEGGSTLACMIHDKLNELKSVTNPQ